VRASRGSSSRYRVVMRASYCVPDMNGCGAVSSRPLFQSYPRKSSTSRDSASCTCGSYSPSKGHATAVSLSRMSSIKGTRPSRSSSNTDSTRSRGRYGSPSSNMTSYAGLPESMWLARSRCRSLSSTRESLNAPKSSSRLAACHVSWASLWSWVRSSTRPVGTSALRSYSRRISRTTAASASLSSLSATLSRSRPVSSSVKCSWRTADNAADCWARAGAPPSGIVTCWSQFRSPAAFPRFAYRR
jgi:hypothetical protein